MRPRPSRVFDGSALADLFRGHRPLHDILVQAEDGWFQILLPTAAMADAEAEVSAGRNGWEAILLTPGVQSLPLTEHAASEIGGWPGTLAARHAAHEAAAVRGIVITRSPGAYEGLRVPLLVV